MKKRIKQTTQSMKNILFAITLFVGTLQAQSPGEILTEEYFFHGNSELDIQLDCNECDAKTYFSACYLGTRGNIRRIVEYSSFPEDIFYILCLYNDDGELQRISMSWRYCDRDFAYGTAFVHKTDSMSVIKYEFTSEDEKKLRKYDVGQCDAFTDLPSDFGMDRRSDYLTADRVAQTDLHLGFKPKQGKKKAPRKVRFDRPKVGDVTFVTANDVNVRNQARRDGEKVGKLNVGNFVVVKDKIKTKDGEIWYEIDCIELDCTDNELSEIEDKLYINGNYLDDTAHEVK